MGKNVVMDKYGPPGTGLTLLRTLVGVRPALILTDIAILIGAWLSRGSRMPARAVSPAKVGSDDRVA